MSFAGRALSRGFLWGYIDRSLQAHTKLLRFRDRDCSMRVQNARLHSDSEAIPMENGRQSFLAKVGQRFNVAGIASTVCVVLRDRQLMIPHMSVPDIRWIDWKALKMRGFSGVVFDKDNTLTAPYDGSVWPSVSSSLQECKQYFGDHIAILSNSAGLYQFDPAGIEAVALEKSLGISVIRHGSKKPAGNADALKKHLGSDPCTLVMVGDRHLTDVVYGNKNGLLTIATRPLTHRGEPFIVSKVRYIEDVLMRMCKVSGMKPPAHALFTSEFEFIKDPSS